MNEIEALISLNAAPWLGPVKIYRCINFFGSALSTLKASKQDLVQIEGVGDLLAEEIIKLIHGEVLSNEMVLINNHDVKILVHTDLAYPKLLKNIYDPPPVLYIKGDLQSEDEKSIAIVGTRKPSQYGKNMSYKFSRDLAELKFTVVSGLARGIDHFAHQGTLDKKGRTLAVLGNGLAHLYPPEHKDLAAHIMAQGALISEFPMSMGPLPQNFPRRNRIISSLTMGTLVVEAPLNSGAMITAHWALEQGREVFAIPGYIGVKNTEGTHRLIKNGAKLVECLNDILEEIDGQKQVFGKALQMELPVLEGEERKVFDILGSEILQIDEICRRTGLLIPALSGILVLLEMKGYIRQLGGKRFESSIIS